MKQEIVETDKGVSQLIRHLETGQLETFVAQYALRYPPFKKDILEYFNPQKPSRSIAEYRERVAACFVFEKPGWYGKQYHFDTAALEAASDLYDVLEKAKYFTSQNNFKEAAAIAQSIIEAIPRNYEIVDDSVGELSGKFKDAVCLLLEIAENENAETELKKEIFNWIEKEVEEKIYSDYGFDNIHSLLIPYTNAIGLFNEALEIADERIQAANDYQLESAVNEKIHLLQQNDLDNEVESTINEYIDLVSIRKLRVDKMLAQTRYSEAIILIKEGIKVAEKKNDAHAVIDWKDQLLETYTTIADHSNIAKHAEDLFYNGRDVMKYYHMLKKQTDTKNWPAYLETLISQPKSSGLFGYHQGDLAKIYIEEQYWERLLRLVEKKGLFELEIYEQYLKPRFPTEVRNLFISNVIHYADRNIGRHHYQKIAGILNKIRSYPGGDHAVDKLLVEFKVKYRARRALMEELREV